MVVVKERLCGLFVHRSSAKRRDVLIYRIQRVLPFFILCFNEICCQGETIIIRQKIVISDVTFFAWLEMVTRYSERKSGNINLKHRGC